MSLTVCAIGSIRPGLSASSCAFRLQQFFALFGLCVALLSCATNEAVIRSAPIEDRGAAATTATSTPAQQRADASIEETQISPAPEQLARLHTPDVSAKPRAPAAAQLLAVARQASASGEHQKAMAALERGLKLAPKDHELWQQLAYTHFQTGDLDQAIALAKRALSLTAVNSAARVDSKRLISAIERARDDSPSAQGATESARD